MVSLGFLIDSICANFTEESMFRLMKERLIQGPFTVDEVLPLIQEKDPSLDLNSAKTLAEAALEALTQSGDIRIEDNYIYPPE